MSHDYPAQYAALQARAEQRRKPLSAEQIAIKMLFEGAKWLNDSADWSFEWNDNDRDYITVRAGDASAKIPVNANPVDAAAVYRAMLRHALYRDWDAPANRDLLQAVSCFGWLAGRVAEIKITRRQLLESLGISKETP